MFRVKDTLNTDTNVIKSKTEENFGPTCTTDIGKLDQTSAPPRKYAPLLSTWGAFAR